MREMKIHEETVTKYTVHFDTRGYGLRQDRFDTRAEAQAFMAICIDLKDWGKADFEGIRRTVEFMEAMGMLKEAAISDTMTSRPIKAVS